MSKKISITFLFGTYIVLLSTNVSATTLKEALQSAYKNSEQVLMQRKSTDLASITRDGAILNVLPTASLSYAKMKTLDADFTMPNILPNRIDKNKMAIKSLIKDIIIPNFGNILNELNQNKIYSQKNKDIITQLYNGDMCSLLFNTTENYDYCKEFLSSILLKGMEQAIIQMGVLINSVIDEISLVDNEEEFKELVRGNTTNYKKYELFIVYFLYHAYLKNDEIFNGLRSDQTNYYLNLTLEIIIIYYIGYFILFIIMCYFIFRYKYIYTSLFNFCAILSLKAISEDEFFYQKILELEKQLYN